MTNINYPTPGVAAPAAAPVAAAAPAPVAAAPVAAAPVAAPVAAASVMPQAAAAAPAPAVAPAQAAPATPAVAAQPQVQHQPVAVAPTGPTPLLDLTGADASGGRIEDFGGSSGTFWFRMGDFEQRNQHESTVVQVELTGEIVRMFDPATLGASVGQTRKIIIFPSKYGFKDRIAALLCGMWGHPAGTQADWNAFYAASLNEDTYGPNVRGKVLEFSASDETYTNKKTGAQGTFTKYSYTKVVSAEELAKEGIA